MIGGCATTIETGPGYYHYDTRAAGSPPAVVYQEPTVTYHEPAVVYQQPAVIYREPEVTYRDLPLVYDKPTVVYRSGRGGFAYHDHGQ